VAALHLPLNLEAALLTAAKNALAARVAGWKARTRALAKQSALLRNVFSLLVLVVAYALRARAERLGWDEQLRRQADAGKA
jgi:hypothetical protein